MNPTPVNSSNVTNFGFSTLFQLYAKQIVFDITGLTTFLSGGAANVVGIFFKVTDPTGIVIKDIDFTSPDIDPSSASTYTVAIPNPSFGFGWWQISGILVDQDNKQYPINLKKEVCVPVGFDGMSVPGTFDVLVNCYTPSLKISETTNLSYNKLPALSTTKSGNLYYPQGTLSAVAFAFTPFSIVGGGQVYTGDYLIKNTTTTTYDLQDQVAVEIKYVTSYAFPVDCNSSLGTVLCCIDDLNQLYQNEPNSERGLDAKSKLDAASYSLYSALIKEKLGQDASTDVKNIKTILNCDCNCTSALAEPIALGTDTNPIIQQFTPAGGVTIDTAPSGNTVNYTISTKVVQFTKQDSGDLAFSITRTDSQYGTIYAIAFDYNQLATTILTTIQNDEGLIAMLKNLVESVTDGVDLSGLTNNCIITINNCNYLLVESTDIAKTITSIKIDGTTHNAPSSLLLTNVSGIATWLNGLTLGTFTANFDSGSQTVSIVSNANPHLITTFIMTAGAVTISRQFTRNCIGLTDVLNAIGTYICALDGTKIKFGATGIQLYTYNTDGSINKNNVSAVASITGTLTNVINSLNALYTTLQGQGFNCISVKALFQPNSNLLVNGDGVFGLKGNACATMPFAQLANILLTAISNDTGLQGQLCGLTQLCAGAVCAPVTNVSATFVSGTLTINCNNNGGGTTPIQIFYRIANSGNTFTEVDIVASALPKAIASLTNGQYEVQVSKTCGNGVTSPVVGVLSNNACTPPVAFSVAISGSNFVVTGTLTSPQTKINVIMTDPNGGQTTVLHDFAATSGTFNIPIPAGLFGNYSFVGQSVCDSTTTPIFASTFTNPVVVTNTNPAGLNFRVSASYNMTFTDVSDDTASGVPTSFNGSINSANQSDNCPSLSSGTISATLTGTPPTSFTIYLRLVKNGTTIIDQVVITAAGTFTLTNSALITYPDQISVEIDQ